MSAPLPAELVTLARHQDGVLSIEQTRPALSPDRLARALAGGTLDRLWHGTCWLQVPPPANGHRWSCTAIGS